MIPLNSAVKRWQPTKPDTGPFRLLVHPLLIDFGGVLVVLIVLMTGVKQSQLLVPRLKSCLWTGV